MGFSFSIFTLEVRWFSLHTCGVVTIKSMAKFERVSLNMNHLSYHRL